MGNKHSIEKTQQAHRAPRSGGAAESTTIQQLAFAAAGAAGSAILGAILTRRGYEAKTVSGALAAIGAGLAGVGDSDVLRALGTGAMSGSGAQLVLMLFSEHEEKKNGADTATGRAPAASDVANANLVPISAKAAAS